MSFLGMGRQQPTSEQKIAAVEGEMRMMADTYNRYAFSPFPPLCPICLRERARARVKRWRLR